jgi:hypothetical protein
VLVSGLGCRCGLTLGSVVFGGINVKEYSRGYWERAGLNFSAPCKFSRTLFTQTYFSL